MKVQWQVNTHPESLAMALRPWSSMLATSCSPSRGSRKAGGNRSAHQTPFERLHEEFKRRIKTQTVLASAETATMLFCALLASGQITMCKVDGWRSLAVKPFDQTIDLAA
jgi:hypothetical protein